MCHLTTTTVQVSLDVARIIITIILRGHSCALRTRVEEPQVIMSSHANIENMLMHQRNFGGFGAPGLVIQGVLTKLKLIADASSPGQTFVIHANLADGVDTIPSRQAKQTECLTCVDLCRNSISGTSFFT